MKSYPSIPHSKGQGHRTIPNCYVWDKVDGNNLRFEWSRKQGWHKFGSRTQLIDESTEQFAGAIPYFLENLAPDIEFAFPRAQHIIAFCEWAGPNSFCGMHQAGDEMSLTLFDICVDKKGFLLPREYHKVFGEYERGARFLGVHNFTRGFADRVRLGEIEGVTFEGVVAKSSKGNQLIMAKAKTQLWIDRVQANYPSGQAVKIINS